MKGSLTISKPVLHLFAVSHFCEKACWALDYHNIEHDKNYVPPGLHVYKAKRLGMPNTTVPILITDGEVIQGSALIIDWADKQDQSRSLTPDSDVDKCREIERRLDEVFAVHVRRYFYSVALLEDPASVRKTYLDSSTTFNKLFVYASWGGVKKLMTNAMDLGQEQGRQSKDIIDGELDWLDELLSDGRQYLVGDRFSRADLTAASLLAPIVLPREHPVYNSVKLPPTMCSDIETWKDRPTIKWVHKIYSKHRLA